MAKFQTSSKKRPIFGQGLKPGHSQNKAFLDEV